MATLDELSRALVAADKAGDVQAAKILAGEITRMRAQPKQDFAFDPMRDMTAFERGAAGAGKAIVDVGRGLGQMVGLVDRKDVAESRKRDAPLMDTTAGTVGNLAGNVAMLAPTAFIPGAATIPGAAASGAATGLAAPSTSTGETVQNALLGGVAAPAAILAGRGLAAGYQGVKGLAEPFTAGGRNRIAGRVINEFASDPAQVAAATSAPTATGARPLLSEAAKDPGMAMLERSLAQQEPKVAAAFGQRAGENNAARVAAVQNIAGTDAQRQAATKALKDTVEIDKELQALLKRPSVQQAVERARNIAQEEGRKFEIPAVAHSHGPKPQAQPLQIVDEAGNVLVDLGAKDAPRTIGGQTLQDLKMGMDALLKDPTSGIAGKQASAVRDTREALVQWMESRIPEFKAAREGWAAGKKPLNQMDVGQRLVDKTTGAIRDHLNGPDPQLRLMANKFATALDDEQTLVRKATGFNGVNALSDVMTPEQMATLNAVRGELELSANLANAANGPGSQTAKSLASANLLRRVLGPTGMPQSWSDSAILQGLARPFQFAMKTAEPKIQNRLAEILMDPQQAAAVMELARALPLSSRIGAGVEPFLPQIGLNPLMAATANRPQ
jgi:hypothetical protein